MLRFVQRFQMKAEMLFGLYRLTSMLIFNCIQIKMFFLVCLGTRWYHSSCNFYSKISRLFSSITQRREIEAKNEFKQSLSPCGVQHSHTASIASYTPQNISCWLQRSRKKCNSLVAWLKRSAKASLSALNDPPMLWGHWVLLYLTPDETIQQEVYLPIKLDVNLKKGRYA